MVDRCSFCGEIKEVIDGQSGKICSECCEIVSSSFAVPSEEGIKDITPKALKTKLDKYVIGQEEAKKTLSVAICNHYKRITMPALHIEKSNILIIGPTGSGKTYLMSSLAKMVDVPFVSVDATAYTQAGYVGEDVHNILQKLCIAANGDRKKAEKGIVYVDEIDKLAAPVGKNKDVNGSGVQQAFLKLMDGGKHTITNDKTESSFTFCTDNVLFVFSGAFNGLKDENKTDTGLKKAAPIGFCPATQETTTKFAKITSDSLINYGFIPEFVGRIPIITELSALTKEDLRLILTKPKNAILKQYTKLFQSYNIKISFSDEFLEDILNEAISKHTGARGLRSCIESKMMNILYEVSGDSAISELIINRDIVSNPAAYLKIAARSTKLKTAASIAFT